MFLPRILPLFVFMGLWDGSFQKNEMELSSFLTEDHSRYARPVLNTSEPVVVTFGFELIHILSVIESEQTIKVKVWLRMEWKNEFLTWDPKAYGGVEKTQLDYETAWTPDIFLVQDVFEDGMKGPDSFNTPIIVSYDGACRWYVPVVLVSSCEFNVKEFPYDQQSCEFKFLSWSHDKSEIDIKIDPRKVVTKDYVISPEWKLLSVDRNAIDKSFACCPNPFVNIIYKLNFARKPLYYIYNLIVPCFILMLIILVQFFLPPESGERIGVLITVLLVFAVYLDVVSGSLPKTSNSVPALSNFYIVSMIISAFSLLATTLVLIIYFKSDDVSIKPVPKWAHRIFIEGINNLLGSVTRSIKKDDGDEYKKVDADEEKVPGDKATAAIAHTMHLDNKKVLDEVRLITKRLEDMDEEDEIKIQWRTLANYLDRLFCVIFFIIFLILSLYVLLPLQFAKKRIGLLEGV